MEATREDMSMNAQRNIERLADDLRSIIRHGEDLVKDIPRDLSDKMRDTRDQFSRALETAKGTCKRLEKTTIAGARATDERVHEQPYPFIGAALAVGILVGLLLGRR